MCFISSGEKAPLERCQVTVTASYLTTLDPSGFPMCFTESGDKAPLSHCQGTATVMSQLSRAANIGPLALCE
jgi:hypothetical protein